MKCLIIFAVVAAVVVVSSAVPVLLDHEGEPVNNNHIRIRRATCDLLSVSTPYGQLNDAACAAHCLLNGRGNRGGHCENGVCYCRK